VGVVLAVGIGLVAIGVCLGWLFGGRLSSLAHAPLRALWLVWLAVFGSVLQWWKVELLLVPFGLVAAWTLLNLRHQPRYVRLGLGGVAFGLVLNGVAIFANDRMPYSVDAARVAGLERAAETARNVPLSEDVKLPWLADIFPVGLLKMVISVGDVAIALATVVLVAALMLVDEMSWRREV
jgi:uncharacterized protein DUF5317